MDRTITKTIVLIALVSASLMGCSSSPPAEDDEAPIESDIDVEEEAAPLEFIDGEPEVEIVGEDGDITMIRVGEVNVLHMATPANEVVAARLYIDGGSRHLTEELQGIERLALSTATNGGTESTPRDEFNARLDAIGASVGASANRDFSSYTMRSVRDYFDETFELFEEAIFEPAFDEEELERRRDRQLASIQSVVDNPDRLVNEVTRDLTFADHPYQFRELGTEETVADFNRQQLINWQRQMMAPERMLMVVVGNIERDELVERVSQRIGRLAPTGAERPELPSIKPEESALRVEEMDFPTNYVLGYYPAPRFGDPDYAALVLATQHLRDRLFEEVRTRRNLTYAVSSGLGNRGTNVGVLYVTAVDPEATLPVIFQEIDRLKEEPIDETTLEEVRNVHLTRHYQGMETNSSIAGQLARAELLGGDWRLFNSFLDEITAVTPEDIQRVADEYIRNIQFGALGDPAVLPPGIFRVSEDEVETVDEIDDADVEPEAEPQPAPEPDAPSPTSDDGGY